MTADIIIAAAVLLVIVVALAWLAVEAWRAPYGYEDSEGFHRGEPGKDDIQ